jgi:hypothetical protein
LETEALICDGILSRPECLFLGREEMLRALLADTEITLGLSGYRNIDEIWEERERSSAGEGR